MKDLCLTVRKYGNNLSDKQRLHALLTITNLGLLSGLLLTYSAWTTARTLPLEPIIPGLGLAAETQTILLTILYISLFTSLIAPSQRRLASTGAIVFLSTLVLLDITRLQPWVFHYGAILLLGSWLLQKNSWTNEQLLDAARITVAGIYFWSGIQKLNLQFFTVVFPWFTEPLWIPFGGTAAMLFFYLGMTVPFIEIGFAVGLFSRQFRKLSLTGSGCMLLFVLACLGPLGHNWNSSVWPWNIAIFSMTLVLFWGTSFSLTDFIKRQKKNVVSGVAFCLFWLVPLGSLVGLTDRYLSWSLYSGTVPEAALVGDQLFLESLTDAATSDTLPLVDWTMHDLNLVPYPETRVFLGIFNSLCTQHPSQPLTLRINNHYSINPAQNPLRTYTCNQE